MTALLIVDLQNDFLPGGALAVPGSDAITSTINRLTELDFDLIVATKDWHPKDHGSFASFYGKEVGSHILLEGLDQILWPDHCVENTKGAEFNKELNFNAIDHITYKGKDRNIDSYSAFFDNGHKKATDLIEILKKAKIEKIYICGLATDYCVKYSAIDALHLGFSTYIIEDACRGVDLTKGDSENSLKEIAKTGGKIVRSEEVIKSFYQIN